MNRHEHYSIWCGVVSDLGCVLGGFHTAMVARTLGAHGKLGGDTARTGDPN